MVIFIVYFVFFFFSFPKRKNVESSSVRSQWIGGGGG